MMMLKRGDRGDKVRVLQDALQRAGMVLEVDGDFGKHTYDAVVAFQQREHLHVDGVAGKDTLPALGLDPETLEPLAGSGDAPETITFDEEVITVGGQTPQLMDFLKNKDLGVRSTGEGLHIGVALLEAIVTAHEIAEIPHFVAYTGTAAGATGGATIAGLTVAFAGPALGLAGTFMALGSGYDEAREEIRNEEIASAFAQGFVAGILNMSPSTTRSLFGKHGVGTRNVADPESDWMKVNAHNRGLLAGYALANTATEDEKKAFVFELRKYVTGVSAGAWGDREKVAYVVEYAAKLRLHYLNKLT